MPNYDYQCQVCQHTQEVFHRMAESPKVKCEKCGSEETQKVISAAQVNMGNYPGTSQGDYNG